MPVQASARLASTHVAALTAATAAAPPPLVVLHGVLASSATYTSLLRRADCAPSSPKVALDLPGHGRSPSAAPGRLSYPSMARDVSRAVADAWPVDVVGHSMGGKVAMALALLYPHMVRKLVVVDIAPVAYGGGAGGDAVMSVAQVAASAMRTVAREGLGEGAFPKRADVDRALEKHGVLDPAVRGFVCTNLVADGAGAKGRWRWRCDVDGIVAAMGGIAGFDLGGAGTGAMFDGPALFIAGGRSGYVKTDAQTRAVFARFPNARVETLAHCGHWLQAEDPKGFCHLLTPFIEATAA
jgi:esterase